MIAPERDPIRGECAIENLILAISCVLPVFIMICTGALIRRSKLVPEGTFNHVSKISFQYLLPCLLFHSIYTTDLDTAFDAKLLTFLIVYVLVWFVIGTVLSTFFVPDRKARGAFIQTFFRSNIAIVGVSMADSLLGSAGVAAISVAIAFLVPLFNVLAVITLETCRGEKPDLKTTLLGIAKNPLIIACVLGLAIMLLKIRLPASVLKAVSQIGTAGTVMTLISLGANFRFRGVRQNLKKVITANLLRLIIAPFVALAAAVALGFRGSDLGIILLCTAPALAGSSYPMAMARDSDHELTGQIVVTSSFLCCLTLFVWIFVLKQIGLM